MRACVLFFLAITSSLMSASFYEVNETSGNVSVIDTNTNMVIATITVGNGPTFDAFTPDNSKVYVSNRVSSSVSVISTASNTVIATVITDGLPDSIAITPDGTKAYVVCSNLIIDIIDTTTNAVVSTIAAVDARQIAITPDGTKAYVAISTLDFVAVLDMATNTFTTTTIAVGDNPRRTAITPDGTKAYVTNANGQNVSVINLATNQVVATVAVGSGPEGIAITPDGTKVFVGNVGAASVSVISTSSNTVIATVPVGSQPHSIAITNDSAKAYVTNSNTNPGLVSVIDIASETVTATVTVGMIPRGIAGPVPPPATPVNFAGIRQFSGFLTQTDLFNGLTWNASSSPVYITGYVIYRDPGLTDLVAVLPPTQLEFLDHGRMEHQSNTYYIVSKSAAGVFSIPASVIVNP